MATDNLVRSSARTLQILETLKEHNGLGVTTLADELDLPKSTIHNHLDTLRQNEYVVKDDDVYKVGLRFLELGAHARSRQPLYEKGKPEVDKLAQSTGELANLATEEYGRGVYLYLTQGDQAVKLDTYAGKRFHLHCTALGKAILAHLPEKRIEEVLDRHGLPRRTDTTITDRDELRQELATVRDQGYAQDMAERLDGLRCVAAPIQHRDGDILGAISVSGPTSRMKSDRIDDDITERLLDAANVIELNIMYA
ncbi:IclR family transcriptional regulator [Saliphagus sp. GCM10025334]